MSNQSIIQIVANHLIGKNILLYTCVYNQNWGVNKAGDKSVSLIMWNLGKNTHIRFNGESQFTIKEVDFESSNHDNDWIVLTLVEFGTNEIHKIEVLIDDELRFV